MCREGERERKRNIDRREIYGLVAAPGTPVGEPVTKVCVPDWNRTHNPLICRQTLTTGATGQGDASSFNNSLAKIIIHLSQLMNAYLLAFVCIDLHVMSD